jgi:hypothetical protein
MSDTVYTAIGLIVLVAWPTLITINALKRKWGFLAFAVLGSPWSILGASRLARPNSWWYRKRYDEAKRARVDERYYDREGLRWLPPVSSWFPPVRSLSDEA